MHLGIRFIVGLLLGGITYASAGVRPSFSEEARSASLDRLAALETFARAGLDGMPLCSTKEGKGLATYASLIEAEVSNRLEEAKKFGKLQEFFADENRRSLCSSRCRCETYVRWLDGAEGPRVSEWKKELERKTNHRALTPARVQACAELNRNWICRSSLWRALAREGVAASESGH